jgi:hypothetical protein
MLFNWQDFLAQWSQELLASRTVRERLSAEVIAASWLGYPGATEAQLAQAEARLGILFPPSYREFLKVTNGWREAGYFIHKLWSTEEIEWHAVRHQDLIDAWLEGSGGPHPVPDEEYFVYGEGQTDFREEYLQTALEISEDDPRGDGVYLLNPQIVTPEGEWEAWFFAAWNEGATRYRSFWEMLHAEREDFLHMRHQQEDQNSLS